MSFSYDNNLTTPLDRIRFEIQDTDADDFDFSDEEIGASYTVNNERIYKTARNLLQKLWIKYAKAPSKVEVDGVRMDNPKRGETFKMLYDALAAAERKENMDKATKGAVYLTGSDLDRFNEVRQDESLVPPRFTRQQNQWSPRNPALSPLNKDTTYYRWYLTDD